MMEFGLSLNTIRFVKSYILRVSHPRRDCTVPDFRQKSVPDAVNTAHIFIQASAADWMNTLCGCSDLEHMRVREMLQDVLGAFTSKTDLDLSFTFQAINRKGMHLKGIYKGSKYNRDVIKDPSRGSAYRNYHIVDEHCTLKRQVIGTDSRCNN